MVAINTPDMKAIAEKLNALTGNKFEVRQEGGVDIIRGGSTANAVSLANELQQSGFNARYRLKQTMSKELGKAELEVVIYPRPNRQNLASGIDITAALRSFEMSHPCEHVMPEEIESQPMPAQPQKPPSRWF